MLLASPFGIKPCWLTKSNKPHYDINGAIALIIEGVLHKFVSLFIGNYASLKLHNYLEPDLEIKTMAKIVISDLHPSDAKTFLHNLTLVQNDVILGSLFQDLWGNYPNLNLTTIQDGVNNTSSTYHSPFGFYDNKILTIDFSRLTINLIVII